MVGEAVADDRVEGGGDAARLVGGGMGEVASQPGRKAWQIGPFEEERLIAAEQHPRRLPQKAGNGDRDDGGRGQYAAIAVAGAFARPGPVDEDDIMPGALQPDGRRHADDARADDRDQLSVRRFFHARIATDAFLRVKPSAHLFTMQKGRASGPALKMRPRSSFAAAAPARRAPRRPSCLPCGLRPWARSSRAWAGCRRPCRGRASGP